MLVNLTTVETIAAAGKIAACILQVGLPAVEEIVKQFARKEGPSLVELEALGNNLTPPDKFFDEIK